MSSDKSKADFRKGFIFALVAYIAWGFFPLYWHQLQELSSIEILCHRIVWSFLFYFGAILYSGKVKEFVGYLANWSYWRWTLVSAILISLNWGFYIYAINSHQVVEGSLGYFLNPILNVLVGVILFKERLSRLQFLAALMATFGVLWMTLTSGHWPWLALILATSFCGYGIIRKKASAHALIHSGLETLGLLPLGLVGVFYFRANPLNEFSSQPFDFRIWSLLIGGGILTGAILYSFSEGARRLPFSYLGFMQFLTPTLQFLTGVFLFDEPMSNDRRNSFVLIWIAIVIFLLDQSLKRSAHLKISLNKK